jgi:type IV pilus assembly protein PilY1
MQSTKSIPVQSIRTREWLRLSFLVVFALLCLSVTALSRADIGLTPLPPYLSETKGTPMVMLNLSRDHQLFYKAYNEYTDLDGDGVVETQYKHSYQYYGYFDNQRCYDYDTTNNRYVPTGKVDASGYCSSQWNGNFMNWATMTRMDVVRRILYGGMRSTDGAVTSGSSLTVLERAHLPTDAHAFAKYYYGNDINKLTPFNPGTTTFTVANGTTTSTVTAAQITVCNATYKNGSNSFSHNAIAPPTIRVVNGNYSLWNANERWQCYWSEDKSASNGNNSAVSGINAASSNPSRATHGLGRTGSDQGSYTARVEVCKTGLAGGLTDDEEARCKLYPLGNYKPTGLLQRYGERSEAAFGLITGSYDKNISGGVVRKNIGVFTDEVDLDDGQFKNVDGIVKTINALRIYGYKYDDGTYLDTAVDNCNFQTIGLTEGSCSSWGNPMGEMYLEALRYFAGKSASSTFVGSTMPKDAAIGISAVTWTDPHASSTVASFGDRLCRRNSIINFNASVTSYDGNQWGGASDIAGLSAATVDTKTNDIGTAEGLTATGKTWAVGDNGTDSNGLCTNKSISALANALGICPESPTYKGSYKVAGAALHAHTNPVRSDITIPASNKRAFRVDTYSVALATGSPRIAVKVPTQPGKTVVIQPAYRLSVGAGGGGTLVDFRVVTQTDTYGKYVVQWEDSEQGGDYDQDVWGTLEYKVVGNKLQISTFVQAESTGNPQGFGYVISGSNKDGVHFHSGIEGFSFTDSTNISVTPTTNLNTSGGCNNCQVAQVKTTAEYDMVGQPAEVLRDPFWYAAKYGGFNRDLVPSYTSGSVLPTSAWDTKKSNGVTGSDGIPDNYFYAVDPAELERSLASVFASILKAGGAAPAAATSSRTAAGGYVYVSTHSLRGQTSTADADASGQFLRYGFQSSGEVNTTPDWDAGARVTIQNWDTGRKILSLSNSGPIRFRWSDLDASQQTALRKNPTTGATDTVAKGQERLEWLRGNSAQETVAGGLRARPTTKLGAIINSTPWYTGIPSAGYTGSQYGGGYPSFRASNTTTNAVFVGANDGMLHAFSGDTGDELFAYVPRAIYSKLSKIPAKDFTLNSSNTDQVTVDGSIMAADIKTTVSGTDTWRTYLFGAMGRGARGFYALDVTKPQSVTESSTSTVVKWEFTDAQDSDMGNIVGRTNVKTNGQPYQVGYMANGKWAAIYGNGYNSTSGKAALFIVFASGPSSTGTWTNGTHYVKIPTGTAGDGPNNGLAAPTAVDANNDGTVDYIYAGDLKGNVWKFDVRSASPASWKVATTGNVPLYQAKTVATGTATAVVQPITTAIQPFPHPNGGYLLVAATGKSLEANDYPMASPYVNTVYGLYDRPGGTTTISVNRSTLIEQTISYSTTTGYRYISGNTIDYTVKDGWYFDLIASSEGVVFNPIYEGENRINLKSIAPSATSDGCRYDSYGFDMTLDAIYGTAIQNLITGSDGVTSVTGAIGGSALNSFEFSKGGVYQFPAGAGGIPPTCVAGSNSNCKCNPSNTTQCVQCTAGKPCCLPWDAKTCSEDKCLFRTISALGSGEVEATERYGSCAAGRLTWREILRVN